ncbi:glycosyltransferase family 2 protein, partial [Enterobacter cloacae complex sp. P25RS]|nr:glycosyltransferase family 2 protein [Enterobacter cloacae complex sp. P25RS]
SEPKTYADSWAKQKHPERIYQEFIDEHRNDVMLNAGLLGGTRADVMAFAHGIIRLYYRIESYRFWKKEQAASAVGDMIAFGIVGQSFIDRLITGPLVHTVFKTDGLGKESAWWQHK